MMNCLFSLSAGALAGVVGVMLAGLAGPVGDEMGPLSVTVSLPAGPPEPDGAMLTDGVLVERRLLAEKALWSLAAVVDRFRMRPFIFCFFFAARKKNRKKKTNEL